MAAATGVRAGTGAGYRRCLRPRRPEGRPLQRRRPAGWSGRSSGRPLNTSMTPTRRPRLEQQPADLEWLVTNGLGGYASGPVVGGLTRRFHGLLIAALPAPTGRLLCLSHMDVTLHTPGGPIAIERLDRPPAGEPRATLADFVLEWGLPVWRYEAPGIVLEKRVVMPYAQ